MYVGTPNLADSPSSSSTHSHASAERADFRDSEQCTDFSRVFPGDWDPKDADELQKQGWSARSAAQKAAWNPVYVPYWTRPDWNPLIEVSIDGQNQRPLRGDLNNSLWPAILDRDQDTARTDYTKRWGINTYFPNTAEGLARSGLTPITAAPDPKSPRQWTDEESWQSWWFDGLTTQELTDTGAYAPSTEIFAWHPLSRRSDDDLHPLFTRSRWAQPRSDEGIGGDAKKMRNFDLVYKLNGIQGRYDAETNDQVWAALRPSMQLASLILQARHPTWAMFLNGIYHMRKVPIEKDGRTDAQKRSAMYRPYRTLWHEFDSRHMYQNARALWDWGFDAEKATMAGLHEFIKWGFYEASPASNAATTQDGDGTVHIFLNANFFWPLLSDDYTEGEKVPIRLKLASTMLHELCHACHVIHYRLMENTEVSLSLVPEIQHRPEIVHHLKELRYEAVGLGDRTLNGRQYFIEDDVQMEEGKSFESRLWGLGLEYFPTCGQPSRLRPMVTARTWPWAHPSVYLQNPESVEAGRYGKYSISPYKTYLLSPPAGVYDVYTPLPVSNYSPLFNFLWWQNELQRYGYGAFKNIMSTQAGQSFPLQSRAVFRYNDFFSTIVPFFGNNRALMKFLLAAQSILTAQKQHLIGAWLNRTGLDMAAAKIMRLRLHYERKTWDQKYSGILDLCDKVSGDIQTARNNLQNEASGSPMDNEAYIHLDTLIRQDLPELYRLMDHEGRYSQNIAAEYFLKNLDDRNLVRRSMHILLGHLQTIHDRLSGVQTNMSGLWSDMGAVPHLEERQDEFEVVLNLFTAAQTAVSNVVNILRGNTLDQREGAHGPLASVAVSQRELGSGRSLRIAALRQFARITDPKLKRLIQTWINIIEYGQDIRLDDPSAEDYVVGHGTTAELKRANDQATADALAIALLEQQDLIQASTDAGTGPGEGDIAAMTDLQQELDRIETASDIIDLYAAFSDDEKQKLGKSPSP